MSCFDTILSVNICDIVIITVKRVDYGYIIHNIIKSKAINLLENFEDGGYIYKILSSVSVIFLRFFFSIYTMVDI